MQDIKITNIRTVLGYAVQNRKGYKFELEKIDPKKGRTVDSFESAGFVHIGRTLKRETWGITKLGDEYYKDLFGIKNYYKKRFYGLINRILKRI